MMQSSGKAVENLESALSHTLHVQETEIADQKSSQHENAIEEDWEVAAANYGSYSKNKNKKGSRKKGSNSKLVSAMKGGRDRDRDSDKQGGSNSKSRSKLTVKWGPDVYDPEPSAPSHTVIKSSSKKQQQNQKSKKNDKNKSKKGR